MGAINSAQRTATAGVSPESEAIVYVVDDDEDIRDSLCTLLSSIGLHPEAYSSAQEFLEVYNPGEHACAIVDARMPKLSGLALQSRVSAQPDAIPIIILTGFPDTETAVDAMKHGAFDYLQKPVRDQQLLDTILRALEEDRSRKDAARRRSGVRARMRRLSPRERQVLALVVEGYKNAEIAEKLGITKRTVELHRVHMMKKMRAESLAELVSLCTRYDDVLRQICEETA